ncbi:radical SAM protein with 4Fe4S-binding SPASM domain [Anaerobacterium chartisolvens]|uniref:Radical SAM protein with 4Fe4S-binding SPASM domain n=1 Tax=Anaerobacterium chartisolvens TaxID=1297424 RepID=A0A369AXP2_9FIRM|nr:radical SAM protein [Anaerobacterium chartisolvens]RCX12977.1 radical SAM protein with 4Fe4S-binding SPASM domain [Anaerobacterium chartisolvens]
MEFKPLAAVWEITMGCNMRCKHCGSACKTAQKGELSTREALKLCDELAELGLKWVTVSGGEALTRNDWHVIAGRLSQNGVTPQLITNAWLVDSEIVELAERAGIGTFAISLDGIKETHDFMRMEGSFKRVMKGFELLKGTSLVPAAITTVTNTNVKQLEQMKEILLEKGVKLWQIQIGLPMGNFAENKSLLLEPEYVDTIIDFAYDMLSEDKIDMFLADCIGYYNLKEIAVRSKTFSAENTHWQGCTAGKQSMGILHNGDILGCTSIRDRKFIEGNIRYRSLKEIWNDENSFRWSRGLSKEKLSGLCKKCGYGDLCLGGCPNTRLTINDDIYSENHYCSYNQAMRKTGERISRINDSSKLFHMGKRLIEREEYQIAEMVMAKAVSMEPQNIDFLNNYGFVSYMLQNYNDAYDANRRALEINRGNIYANKGMGLTLVKLGRLEDGIGFLKRSAALTTTDYMVPYYDLALTLIQNNRSREAEEIIEEGKRKSPDFVPMSEALYGIMAQT